MEKKAKDISMGVKLTSEIKQQLKAYAAAKGVSEGTIVRWALEGYLASMAEAEKATTRRADRGIGGYRHRGEAA